MKSSKFYLFNQDAGGWAVTFDVQDVVARDVPLHRALQLALLHHQQTGGSAITEKDQRVCESEETLSIFSELFNLGRVKLSGEEILRLVR